MGSQRCVLVLAVVASLTGLCATTAHGSLEEFETWDLGAQELDDEYGLDTYFIAYQPRWQADWRRALEGARVSLGCVTRELWEMQLEVKLERQLHRRLRFAYGFHHVEGLAITDQQHRFGVEVGVGPVWVAAFARPHSAKERHDFGLAVRRSWETGYVVELGLTFEDALNNFWTERSFLVDRRRVDFLNGGREWRLAMGRHWARSGWLESFAVVLPEVVRAIAPPPSSGAPAFSRTLDGNLTALRGGWRVGQDGAAELHLWRKQTRLADRVATAQTTATDQRRLAWLARGRLEHRMNGAWRLVWAAQLRRNREENVGASAPYRLRTREVMGALGVARRFGSRLRGEVGYAHQDVNVDQVAPDGGGRFTFGTRTEGRFYLSVDLHFAGLRLRLTETLEVDGESYNVVGVHDKGFIQIQAAF